MEPTPRIVGAETLDGFECCPWLEVRTGEWESHPNGHSHQEGKMCTWTPMQSGRTAHIQLAADNSLCPGRIHAIRTQIAGRGQHLTLLSQTPKCVTKSQQGGA